MGGSSSGSTVLKAPGSVNNTPNTPNTNSAKKGAGGIPGTLVGKGAQGTVYRTTGKDANAAFSQPHFTMDVFNKKPAPNALVAIKSFHMRHGETEAANLLALGKTKAKSVVPRFYYSAKGKYQSYYIVMEYIPCPTLKHLPAHMTDPWFIARLEYAVYLLRRYGGVAHADMHTDNIVVCPKTGKIVLIDFGFTAAPPKTTYASIRDMWAHVNASDVRTKTPRNNLGRLSDMWARLPGDARRARAALGSRH